MPYTGNLVVMAQQPDARQLPPPSNRHGRREGDPSAPSGQNTVPAGVGSEFQGTDFAPVVMSGFGMPLDDPAPWGGDPPGGPYETDKINYPRGNPHDSHAVLSQVGGDTQWRAGQGGGRTRAHDGEPDRGWLRTTFDPAPQFMGAQPREEIDTQGLNSPYTDGGPRMQKMVHGNLGGYSSLPESNPPRVGYDSGGFRLGRERVRVWANNVFASTHRRQGVQIIRPRDAYTPNPAQRMVETMITPPSLPRDPGNPDDVMIARSVYATAPSSVFGGF